MSPTSRLRRGQRLYDLLRVGCDRPNDPSCLGRPDCNIYSAEGGRYKVHKVGIKL